MHRVSTGVLLVAVAALAPFATAAQEATPPPGASAPGPEECRVAPPAPEAILAVLATPDAEPAGSAPGVPASGGQLTVASEEEFPTGEPAEEATAEAVEAVVRELTACNNANDYIRELSLVSDDLLRTFLPEVSMSEVEAELATAAAMQPTPRAEDDRTVILAIRDARVFPDGRVGVVIVTDSLDDEEDPRTSFTVLVESEGRWLVDAVILVESEDAAE